jgi:type VI protein secretion system component VasK
MAQDSALTTVWSFVTGLFQQVIVSDRDRVGGAFHDRKLELYRRIAFASMVFICLLLSVFFVVSWAENHALLRDAQQAAADVVPLARIGDPPTSENLLQIEQLRSVLSTITHNYDHGAPWDYRFFLYAGESIRKPLHDLYFQRFREYFLDNTLRQVQTKLSGLPPSQNPAFDYKTVYDDLKGLRTITTTPEESSCSADSEFAQWVMGTWRGNDLAERQFKFYVDELRAKRNPYPNLQPAPVAVTTARNYLRSYSGIEPQYQGIIAAVNQEMQSVARLSDYTRRAPDTLVLTAGSEVPGAFTPEGWQGVKKRIASAVGQDSRGDTCVVGGGEGLSGHATLARDLLQGSDIGRQLTNRYIQDYIAKWKTFLSGASVQVYKDPADAAHKLDFLSSNTSPLLAVLAMIAENTKLPDSNSSGTNGVAAQLENQAKQGFVGKVGQLLGRAPAAAKSAIPKTDPGESLGPEKIKQVFEPTQDVFQTPMNKNRLIDDVNTKYINALLDLQAAMSALGQASDPGNADLNKAASEKAQAAIREAKLLANKFDSSPDAVGDPVSTLLLEPIKEAQRIIVTNPGDLVTKQLEAGLRDLCAKLHPMLRKYPFSALADQQVDLNELKGMFAPAGGAFWSFHQQNTMKLLEKRGSTWVLKPDANPKVTDRFLDFFKRMARISDALFPPDGEAPAAQFKLSLPAAQGYQSVIGPLDGDQFSSSTKQYSWPGQQLGVDLRVVLNGNSIPFAKYDGLWGLFHWMQSAEDRPPGSSAFGFKYQRASRGSQPQTILESGLPIKIQVDEFPNKIDTAFDRDFFTGIECPVHATQ